MIEDNIKQIREELSELIMAGFDILKIEAGTKEASPDALPVTIRYQHWYTRSLAVVRQLLPDRLTEFQKQYEMEKRKEINFATYTISDYLIGLQVTRGALREPVVNSLEAFKRKFQHQIAILSSAHTRIDSLLSDIRGVLKADLFDTELDKAKELVQKGHLRAGGVIAGVVLESHLSGVCDNHAVKSRKRRPTISDHNDLLKKAGVYEVPTWRLIQRLGDLRNLCAHSGDHSPSREDVDDLIAGVEKVTKTVH
jgi:hypothetical protein